MTRNDEGDDDVVAVVAAAGAASSSTRRADAALVDWQWRSVESYTAVRVKQGGTVRFMESEKANHSSGKGKMGKGQKKFKKKGQ